MRERAGIGGRFIRSFFLVALLAIPIVAVRAVRADTPATPTAGAPLACSQGDEASWNKQIEAYKKAGKYPTTQEPAEGLATSVMVEIPPITFTGPGLSSTLPVGPCQFIYRYEYQDVKATGDPGPFKYLEIDWNTEGEPRGPNGAFQSAHFDFHFYMLPREDIEGKLTCVSSNGKTCDPFKTDWTQTKRFLNLPDAEFVPETYRADIDSSIPAMGLHSLDLSADYTVDAVNHTPVLIYGSFDGKIVFAESSVTLDTLQDAIADPNHRISFPYRQPALFSGEIDWPTEFVIEYLPETGGFRAGFAGFQHHAAG